jgi:23S rRNA pseudouridine2605 synthase
LQKQKFTSSSYSATKHAAKKMQGARTKVRLQKFLASCGVASRRGAEQMIVDRRVSVNGEIVTELGFQVRINGQDKVSLDGRVVTPQELGILLLNKPKFVISTLADPEGRPCLAHYLTKKYSSYFPVGRLDWESEGLVILTNDGDLADSLLHPRYQLYREYEVEVEGYLHDKAVSRLKTGVQLDDGIAKAIKLRLHSRDQTGSALSLVVGEGRNRLVRRMLDAVDCPVTKLTRVSHGPFKLGRIKPGEVQKLSLKEYIFMKRAVEQLLDKLASS